MDYTEGNYDNCPIKEMTFGEGDFGPQWVITFDVQGANKIVYLGTGTDRVDQNGKTDQEKTVATLAAMGWNRDFDNPKCEVETCNLRMKINANGKERWYISDGKFNVKPASVDQRQNFMTAFRATVGAPKPAGARPAAATATAPARPTAAPARPTTAPAKPAPKGGAIAKNADEAWSAVIKVLPKADSVTFWNIVAQIGEENSIAEADFTPALWQKVVDAASLPDAPFA